MPPLNPNSTARVKVIYENAIAQHVSLIRVFEAASVPVATDAFEALTTALTGLLSVGVVTGVQFAAQGSDIFTDVPASTLLGHNWGTGLTTEENNAVALNFIGRSTTGRRVRWALFGYNGATSAYRLTSLESSAVAAAVAILEADADVFQAIDGSNPVWKPYANVKAFDHWVDVARNG
jgi:hypothetical protein